MKIVLFCGGLGTRLREHSETIPKPLVNLDYRAAMSADFVLSEGGRRIELFEEGIDDWRITFVDTGMHSNLGQRLLRVKHLVESDDMFLANYSDGLSDLPLDRHVSHFLASGAVASFL